MSRAIDTIFGSKSKSEDGATTADIDRALAFIKESTTTARQDIFDLAPQAINNRQAGYQGASDIFQKTIPEQIKAYQLGNQAAQRTQSEGLPQQIAALMGQNIDMGAFQPRRPPTNLDMWENNPIFAQPKFQNDMPASATTSVSPAVLDQLNGIDSNAIQAMIDRFNGGGR